jgi:hypothetical protein
MYVVRILHEDVHGGQIGGLRGGQGCDLLVKGVEHAGRCITADEGADMGRKDEGEEAGAAAYF